MSTPWDKTPEELRTAEAAYLPRHAATCALVKGEALTCTCGTLSAHHAAVNAAGVRNWRNGYAAGRAAEAAGEPAWDRPLNATGERKPIT